ncbi:MAG: tyrosine-protein phosphatase [Myxococcales bacterium]|nr:tyrosine-protein phosphatase [Myxococcales bacterium]
MQRQIDLDGCHNFRDLGGYPAAGGRAVRWRVLFRSDALHHLTAEDVARVRDDLGIRDVVDLRSAGERRSDGRGPLEGDVFRFHHVPLFDGVVAVPREFAGEMTLADRYFLLAEMAKPAIARVITTLAASSAPAVYHCAAGKDRTGVISAILLGLLGVPDGIIIADYAATQENLDAIIDRLMATEGYREMLEALPPDTLHAEPATMVALLDQVRGRYGSMREYVRAIGVSDESLSRLEIRLLD